jgi:hypothetical protein
MGVRLLCLLFVCCVGSGLYYGPITNSEESYLCVCVCVCLSNYVCFRNLINEAAWARVGLLCHGKMATPKILCECVNYCTLIRQQNRFRAVGMTFLGTF